jgi:folylpolyglutamate synthase/dihydropteroate synthase
VDVSEALQPTLQAESVQMLMLGHHNVMNAATAVGAVEAICSAGDVVVRADALQRGLRAAKLPGRFDLRWQPGADHPLLSLPANVAHLSYGVWA